jgi:hypothetical protein
LRWAALAAAAFGYGMMVRPVPTAFFVVAWLAAHLTGLRAATPGGRAARWAREAAIVCAGVAAGVAVVLLVNHVQSGDALSSGYHSIHGGTGSVLTDPWGFEPGLITRSTLGALVRQSFWLHGWPLSFAFIPFARLGRGSFALWSLIAAEYVYRVTIPKTAMATTGPIYVLEVVPLLCIATVAGAASVAAYLGRRGGDLEAGRRAVAAVVLASMLVALTLFIPVALRAIDRAASARAEVYEQLAAKGATRAVVFASVFVGPMTGRSWAYFPPNPSPDLDDDLVFLRMLDGPAGYDRMLRLWQTRFADRRALLLLATLEGPVLQELPIAPGTRLPSRVIWSDPR